MAKGFSKRWSLILRCELERKREKEQKERHQPFNEPFDIFLRLELESWRRKTRSSQARRRRRFPPLKTLSFHYFHKICKLFLVIF
ncbi:hypothetical protein PRUPE_1G093100 [Prunus persica]|uniref:Uncharacterized protein n=1 Tax=Prunus persica TaxID=3760 RepID=A0A251QUT8_PRUPE|nr:hypothetical protein PRUPE_1G093100 [Prunus persica]